MWFRAILLILLLTMGLLVMQPHNMIGLRGSVTYEYGGASGKID